MNFTKYIVDQNIKSLSVPEKVFELDVGVQGIHYTLFTKVRTKAQYLPSN